MTRVILFRIEPAGYMLALARALQNAWSGQIDVVFMTRAKTQKWDIGDQPFTYHVLPEGRFNAAHAMYSLIAKTQPDLLHLAGWSVPPSLAAILAGYVRCTPIVIDLDTWRGTPSRWRGPVKKFVLPRLFQGVSHFAPGGKRQASYLRGFGVPDEKITTVGMTVDVNGIRSFLSHEPSAGVAFRQRFEIAPNATMALFLGRLVGFKGLSDLLAAWRKTKSEVPGAQLVVAGDGELRSLLAEAAAVDPSIHPIGRLNGDDVWRAYAAADFVVAPSLFEPWGLIVNEAMAAGTPIILSDIFGCVGDLARHNESAIIFPAGSSEHLAAAMIRLARNPMLRKDLANVASKLISYWTIENEAEKIVNIWRRQLAVSGISGDTKPTENTLQ